MAGAPNQAGDRNGKAELHRHEGERDPFSLPAAEQKRQQHAGGRNEDRQRQQTPARRRREGGGALGHSALGSVVGRFGPSVRTQRRAASLLEQAQRQCDRERAGREGDDNPGDHHRLRNRIGGQSRRRAFPCDDAEHEENAAADQVERQNLAQRLRIGDHAIEAKTDKRRPDQPGQRRRAHRRGSRRGGPATSIGRVTAMVKVMKVSMNRISGLASPGG